jgi:hypothetical protein
MLIVGQLSTLFLSVNLPFSIISTYYCNRVLWKCLRFSWWVSQSFHGTRLAGSVPALVDFGALNQCFVPEVAGCVTIRVPLGWRPDKK